MDYFKNSFEFVITFFFQFSGIGSTLKVWNWGACPPVITNRRTVREDYKPAVEKAKKGGSDCEQSGQDYRVQFSQKHFSSEVVKKIKDCENESKSGKEKSGKEKSGKEKSGKEKSGNGIFIET